MVISAWIKSGPCSKVKSCPHAYIWKLLIFSILEGGSPFFKWQVGGVNFIKMKKKILLEKLFIIFYTIRIFEKTISNIDFDILYSPLFWEAHIKKRLNFCCCYCKLGGGGIRTVLQKFNVKILFFVGASLNQLVGGSGDMPMLQNVKKENYFFF